MTTLIKTSATILLMLAVVCSTKAQNDQSSPGLSVGDPMPNYTFTNLINYPSRTASIGEFKGKWLILDFWSTGCASCIESWPKLLDLQSKYDGKIQIVLVNSHQDEGTVRTIFEKRKRLADVNMTLPSVCGDTVLSKMFPRLGVPHIIWIDPQGYVRSKTQGPLLNSKNIALMLTQPGTQLPQAQTDVYRLSADSHRPLFIEGNAGDGDGIEEYSVLSKFVDDISFWYISMNRDTADGMFNSITAVNQTIRDLYGFAFSDRFSPYETLEPLQFSRVIMDGFDSSEYATSLDDGITIEANRHMYQLITAPGPRHELQAKMQADLARYFGYQAHLEQRRILCRVLKMTDTTRFTKPTPEKFDQAINASKFSVNGAYSMNTVLWRLEDLYYHSKVPVLDETGLKGRLYGIDIAVNALEPDKLDAALRPYGMSFKEEYRSIAVLVVSKNRRHSEALDRKQ